MLNATQPPWHMWGNTQRVTVQRLATGVDLDVVSSFEGQMLKVSYGRPDSWHWVLAAKLISSGPALGIYDIGPPQINAFGRVDVRWHVTIGLARSVLPIKSFETHTFLWDSGGSAAQAPNGLLLWSTQTNGNRLSDVQTGRTPLAIDEKVTCQEIVAQEIQVQAEVDFTSLGGQAFPPPQSAVLELTAFFAPKTHVRPDWMLMDRELSEQFAGGEIGGR
jgi:hypothetical protein